MEQIITDIEKLKSPAEPLKFMDETGTHKEEGIEIISKIKEVMEANKNILALAAPQIGICKRIFCIRFNDIIKTFINPIIKKKSTNGIIRFETNASMPNKEIAICRPKEIELVYYTDEFKYEDNKLLGSAAAIFMQQYELLDGIVPGETFKDIINNKEITADIIPAIIAGEYSGDGIIADIAADNDHFTTDDIAVLAELIGKQQAVFQTVGKNLLTGTDDILRPIYKNFKRLDKICLGEMVAIEEQPKMNREQRRAAAKNAKKLQNKKAGK